MNQAEANGRASASASDARTGARPPPADPLRRKSVPTRCWVALATGAGLALLVWPLDQRITDILTKPAVREGIYQIFALPTAVSFYAIVGAILAAQENRRRLLSGFVCAILSSAALTHLIKFVVGRARPSVGLGPEAFDLFNLLGPNQSFPSGHASAAATLAVLLGLYFPTARWVFYFYAGCVGLERIVNNRHFTSDVLFGFVLGAFAVYACVALLGRQYFELQPRRP